MNQIFSLRKNTNHAFYPSWVQMLSRYLEQATYRQGLRFLCTAIIVVVTGFSSLLAKSSLVPERLRVEYLDNPLGLDEKKPRFSWLLTTNNHRKFGQQQTAYRIVVARSPKALKRGDGVWDSGWVNSSETKHIVYAGLPLLSDQRYYWSVTVKDEDGNTSGQSETAYWTTGLLSEEEWKGRWIGDTEIFDPEQVDCNIWDPWLRKSFELTQKPKKANFYVASIGFHEVYVNGQRVGNDVMAPAVSDHTKRARYVVYDIAPYLQKGRNVIGIWLGTSWSIFPAYHVDDTRPLLPIVSAQVDFFAKETTDEGKDLIQTVITDSSWKVKKSPNKLLGRWDFRQMGGELRDDRKREDDWNKVFYNDEAWTSAKEYPVTLAISAQRVEGNHKVQKIDPIAIEEKGNGIYRIDMGVNFAGWTAVKVKGNPGDKITFLYSEREQEEETFGLHSAFIIGERGEGIFKNRFNYSSGRWITIKGLSYKPSLQDIQGWLVRTDYEEISTFECLDSLQNWIYDRIKWTFENLSIGGFIVDCPQRERMGYGGDAHATSETGMLNYDLGAFYTKWMQDWRDVQGTEPMVGDMRDSNYARKEITSGRIFNNGILPHTAPTYWGGGGPAWGGIVVSLPWFMYQHYGDERVLLENYELIKKWLAFLDTHVENDLLQRFGGTWDFLGDWLWPNATAEGMNNNEPETVCLNNLYRVFNLRTAAKIAEVIGDVEQASQWTGQADRSSKAINACFYNPTHGTYADGSMANLATALLAEAVPNGERAKVMSRLEEEILINRDGHIHAGITGGALLFKLLRSLGRNDLIYSMTSKVSYPSWGFMRAHHATTIWEMWEKDLPGHSLLHSSFLYPGAWSIDGLAGIKRDEPGYSRFVIEPPAASETDLTWSKASFKSPAGLIQVHWKRDDGKMSLDILVPPNTTCLLRLTEDDARIMDEQFDAVTRKDNQNGKVVYELLSGKYSFKE